MNRRASQKPLTKLARGRECQIRVPLYCCDDNTTVVPCHVRLAGISGAGYISDAIFVAHGCHRCHAVVDGQQDSEYTFEQRRLMLLEGMVRTQAILLREGKIHV